MRMIKSCLAFTALIIFATAPLHAVKDKDKHKKDTTSEHKKDKDKDKDKPKKDKDKPKKDKDKPGKFTASEAGYKGKKFPKEWKTLPALDPNFEVMQLTTSKAMDSKLYLKINPYVPSLNSVVFNSDRSGEENLFLMSLETGEITQITEGKLTADHAGVAGDAEMAFYRAGKSVYSVNLNPPYNETKIITIDSPYRFSGEINTTPNGKFLSLALYDEGKKKSIAIVIDVDKKSYSKIWEEEGIGRIDHNAININGTHLLYHVYETRKIVVVDIAAKKGVTVGTNGVHPFWFYDSKRVAFRTGKDMIVYDVEKKKSEALSLSVSGNHFAINPSGTMFQGDGHPKDPFIYFYPYTGSTKLTGVKMFRHGSSSTKELWHPHAHFIGENRLMFSSDVDGNSNVYLLQPKK